MKAYGLVIIMFAVLIFGCKPSSTTALRAPGSVDAKKAVPKEPEFDPEQLAYNLKTTVEAYDIAGSKNPKWDDLAKNCMTTFSQIRSLTNNASDALVKELNKQLTDLAELKCDDSMIRYLHTRFIYSKNHTCEQCAAEFGNVASDMLKSAYPDIRKYYILMWQRNCLVTSLEEQKKAPSESLEVLKLAENAAKYLAKALNDKSMSLREVDQACGNLMTASGHSEAAQWIVYRKIEAPLIERWNDTRPMLLTKGRAYYAYAWTARGHSFADTVSDEDWRLTSERIEIACDAYEAAWKLRPDDPEICREMIGIELLQNKGRERMEQWFERGMNFNPGYYDLCYAKLNYLRARWHGSIEEMIAFGRECTENQKYTGAVRLMLVDAHFEACRELQDKNQRRDYWKQKSVWTDIQFTFEQFFKLYPDQVGYRHNYARFAAMCGQWKTVENQLKLFPSTNYAYFGGVESFNEMVGMMRASTGK